MKTINENELYLLHAQVGKERVRQIQNGYDADHDDQHGIQHLLGLAENYIVAGQTIKGLALIRAAREVEIRLRSTNSMQRDIEKFMAACDQEVKKYPELPSTAVRELRIKLMVEELMGSTHPNGDDSIGYGLILSKSDELIQSMINNDLVGIADGIADVLYVVIGTAAAYGINIQAVFNEVQRSNMSKTVWNEDTETYTVIKNEYGKVMKPESYSPPVIEPIILSAIKKSKSATYDLQVAQEKEESTDHGGWEDH